MTSLIKNQIIKNLSKFVKNLSANQINISTIRGEGELSSINLDERALEEVTGLPTWLKIQKATCGRLYIKIPWTNLRHLPIQIQLDDVDVEIETCEQLRDVKHSSNGTDLLTGPYGTTNRVIDGVSLSITNLTFTIKAKRFKASFCLPTLDVYSVAPNGKQVNTLTLTRIRNAAKDHILLFKEIYWPNARIEASSYDTNAPGTSVRFIVNACRMKILMKKNLQDSSMVSSRVMILFDDFLSVLNDSQLKAALNTYKEIDELMKRASEQQKQYFGDKLEKCETPRQSSTFAPKLLNSPTNDSRNTVGSEQTPSDLFERYNIIETSLHLNIKRLDLHIQADSDALTDRPVENGAIQITIANLSIDHYPYHESGSSKKHWIKYGELQSMNRNEWISALHAEWQEQLNAAKSSAPSDETSKKFEKVLRTNQIRLFESCSILHIDDFVFYPIALNNDKGQKRRRPLISSDQNYYHLPDNLGIINIQHTEYYYPTPYSFPVPNSDIYVQIMPLVVRLDFDTLHWLHAFVSALSITIDDSGVLKTDKPMRDLEHVAIKFEAVLPRFLINTHVFSKSVHSQQNEPSKQQQSDTLEINVAKVSLTNTRTDETSSRNTLQRHLELFKDNNFFQQTQWPFSNETTTRISSLFEKRSYDTYLYNNPLSDKMHNLPEPPSAMTALHTYYTMTTDSLKKSAKYDIWNLSIDNVYLDFSSSSSTDSRSLVKENMTDTLSLTGWIVLDRIDKDFWLNMIYVVENSFVLKVTQYQYTFIMHFIDELGLFIDTLKNNVDRTNAIKKNLSLEVPSSDFRLSVCLMVPKTFILAVINNLENTAINPPTPTQSISSEIDVESYRRSASETNLILHAKESPSSQSINPTKVDKPIQNKTADLSTQKKSKFDGLGPRGLDIVSKGARGSSMSSLMNMSDNSDETSSQWDANEELNADIDSSVFSSDAEEQQEQVMRLTIDDEPVASVADKINLTQSKGLTNGVFIKLSQIDVCLAEDCRSNEKEMFLACGVKYIRIDDFSSLRLDSIKPKLFDHEKLDEYNTENVPPINLRIDLPKGELSSLPIITIHVQDRLLHVAGRALDAISQNLEEILTPEEKLRRLNEKTKMAPIDLHLNNVQITLEPLQSFATTANAADRKPPLNLMIEYMHFLRQIDGKFIIRKMYNNDDKQQSGLSSSHSLNVVSDVDEKAQQFEALRRENDRLRSELASYKTEVTVLRGERDCLMQTISKLDIELTQAEFKRISQQQQQQQRKK